MTTENGRLAITLTVLGMLAAVACFLALWRLPVYGSGATLAEENGDWVLLLAGLPVVVALVAWGGLYAACSRGSRVGRAVAGVAVGLLGFVALLGAASIGMFLLPAAALLCGAVVMTPLQRDA